MAISRGHHEPIHVKFRVWGFFIMFYWNMVMKMLKCKKENLMTSHFSTLCNENVSLSEKMNWGNFHSKILLLSKKSFYPSLDLQSRFWPLLTCEGWNFAKSRNFDSCQKFNSKLTFLTTRDMQRMKCGKIQKFSIAIKIKPKIESFDHSGHAKDEIWQNPEIFSHAENLAKKWECWPLWTSKGWNLTKSRKIWFVLKIWLKNRFLTTPDLRRMKFGKSRYF